MSCATRRWSLLAIVTAVIPLGLSSAAHAAPATPNTALQSHAACADNRPGLAHCLADVMMPTAVTALTVAPHGRSSVTYPNPVGWTPSALANVYGIHWGSTAGATKKIAIVDAYNSPTIAADLATFSTTYGLHQCTVANGCFTKVNQNGGATMPATDVGWALEINLDVEWAHAIAPAAKIELVEASSASFSDLMTAENTARNSGAQVISNSWGASEFAGEASLDDAWTPGAGQTVFFAAGDSGVGAEYPSSDPNVVSVGGTNVHVNGKTVTETAWSGGGGGCSAYEAATVAQKALGTEAQAGCGTKRATPDLSAIADPATGVGVYTTTAYSGVTGWLVVGGTSLASPVVAATTVDNGVTLTPAMIYGSTMSWRDVTAGTNGAPCRTGYDLCSGRGTWLTARNSVVPVPVKLY